MNAQRAKRAVVASLHFSPGHLSHINAFEALLAEIGFEVELWLDDGYETMRSEIEGNAIFRNGKEVDLRGIDLLIIYNLSKHDSRVIRRVKTESPGCKALLVYHEPYLGLKKGIRPLMKGKNSIDDTVRHFGRHLFSTDVLRRCDGVLLPSENAVKMFERYDVRYSKKYHCFPLIFKDEAVESDYLHRLSFSFVGTACPDHGFEEFLSFMDYTARKRSAIRFAIATKSSIGNEIDRRFNGLVNAGRLSLLEGHPLSNEQINGCMASSIATWLCYRRSTQSGVLCKSFMHGTPVVATDVGSFSTLVDGGNGLIVDDPSDYEGVLAAFDSIAADFQSFSDGARSTYIRSFDYRASLDVFANILNEL